MRSASSSSPALPNFRDVGGHPTHDGCRVRMGLLYRSAALDRASDDDLRVLGDLGIVTVFDLRTRAEHERRPTRLPAGARVVWLDVLADAGEADPSALFDLMRDPPRASIELAGGGSERFFLATYRDLVRLPSARAAYAQLYRTIAGPGGRPSLVHCTTGKDRTGWAVAALLLFLGVRADAVVREYLQSDREVRRAFTKVAHDFEARGGDPAVLEPLIGVRPSFLDAAIDAMHEAWGPVEAYFAEGLWLDDATLAALRTAFLERA